MGDKAENISKWVSHMVAFSHLKHLPPPSVQMRGKMQEAYTKTEMKTRKLPVLVEEQQSEGFEDYSKGVSKLRTFIPAY